MISFILAHEGEYYKTTKMKNNIIILLFVVLGFTAKAQTNAETLQSFLSDVISFEETTLDSNRPMPKIRQMASVQSDTLFVLSKDNASEVFANTSDYKHCLVFTGSHTIVKVTDFNKRIASGSWQCKMPFGVGYIQRGDMTTKEDYINNIIGVPDAQKRVVFFFK